MNALHRAVGLVFLIIIGIGVVWLVSWFWPWSPSKSDAKMCPPGADCAPVSACISNFLEKNQSSAGRVAVANTARLEILKSRGRQFPKTGTGPAEHAKHTAFIILKLVLFGLIATLFIVGDGWDCDDDDDEDCKDTGEHIELAISIAEGIFLTGAGLYLLYLFWPDDLPLLVKSQNGTELSSAQKWSSGLRSSPNGVVNRTDRVVICAGAALLGIIGIRTIAAGDRH